MASNLKHPTQATNDLMMTNTEQGQTQTPDISPTRTTGTLQQSNDEYEDLQESLKESHEYEDLKFKTSACHGQKSHNKIEPSAAAFKSKTWQPALDNNPHGSSTIFTDMGKFWTKVLMYGIPSAAGLSLGLVILLITGVIGPKCGCDKKLETSLQAETTNVDSRFNSSHVSQLQLLYKQLKMELGQINSTLLLAKINNMNGTINGMQGPPGPPGTPGSRGPKGHPGTPGAGNLSQCYHKQNKFEGFSTSTSDDFINFVVPKDEVVLGATCSTIRGDETNLSTSTNSRGQKVYSCQCKGQSNVHNDAGNSKCFIDVWVCPRLP